MVTEAFGSKRKHMWLQEELWRVKGKRTRRIVGNEHTVRTTCSAFVIFVKLLGNH